MDILATLRQVLGSDRVIDSSSPSKQAERPYSPPYIPTCDLCGQEVWQGWDSRYLCCNACAEAEGYGK